MKKLSIISFVFCCFSGGTILFGSSVETSMSLVKSLLLKKKVVSANTVYAYRGVNDVQQKYLNFVAIIETNYSFLSKEQKYEYLEMAAKNNGKELLNRTSKFLEIIRKYKELLAPIIEDGFSEKQIDYKKSVLYDFLYGPDPDDFKTKLKTPEGFLACCKELQVLFEYLIERVPEGFEIGAEYLDQMKDEEKEEDFEDGPEEEPAKE